MVPCIGANLKEASKLLFAFPYRPLTKPFNLSPLIFLVKILFTPPPSFFSLCLSTAYAFKQPPVKAQKFALSTRQPFRSGSLRCVYLSPFSLDFFFQTYTNSDLLFFPFHAQRDLSSLPGHPCIHPRALGAGLGHLSARDSNSSLRHPA